MKKKLYYVSALALAEIDGIQETTGVRQINAYVVENNELVPFFNVEGSIVDSSVDLIQNYLNDNGHGDEDIEFVEL